MFVRFAVVCLTAATLITPAEAGSLSAAAYSASVSTPSVVQIHSPGTVTASNGLATVTDGGHAEVSGFVTYSQRYLNANGYIGYDFEFFGPDGSINVDADVALYSQSNQNNVITSAYFMVQNAASENIFVLGDPYGFDNMDITQTVHLELNANTLYHVLTGAQLHGNRILEIDASGNAYVNSRVYLSPQFGGDASAYTMELSPGISFDNAGSGSEAPEPASMGMLLGGMAAIGLVRRHRKMN